MVKFNFLCRSWDIVLKQSTRKMADKDGPIIADAFYEELFRGTDLKPALEADTTKSAQALHDAVKKLRSQNASFGRWIPFINIGK